MNDMKGADSIGSLAETVASGNCAPGGSYPAPRLCGALLGTRPHVCAFFHDIEEEDRALLPFMKEGLTAGEKIVATIDPARREESIGRFVAAGLDFSPGDARGRFDLHAWTETHLDGGTFVPERTLGFFSEISQRASSAGFPLTRFITHMEWALEAGVLLTDLLEYEAKANEVWMSPTGPINPVICAYDLRRFSAEVIVDVMRTHPMTLIDGMVYENPFFVPPEEFVQELRNGRTARAVGARPWKPLK
jgi:hypothetical protein